MLIAGIGILDEAAIKNTDAANAIETWIEVVLAAEWRSLIDVRSALPSSDGVSVGGVVVTVFNVRGNRYRLITQISYALKVVNVRFFMTHAEYSKEKWKRKI